MTTELLLSRDTQTADATLGRFYWGDDFLYYTVEDLQRPEKIYGVTAIPCGRYKITITHSPHFNKDLPLVNNVPGYTGVRIHAGNTSEDTDGCVIIGLASTPDGVASSQAAMAHFMPKLEAALLNGDVWLTITSKI